MKQNFHQQPIAGRWPFRRRVIWSCDASRGPLLTRYYLMQTRWFSVLLHHLQASDEDRALHDHPWAFVTVLLTGGYWEWTPGPSPTWRRRFSFLYRPARFAHRLELERPVWTLVVHFKRVREWGFFAPGGWMDWKAYGREFCD